MRSFSVRYNAGRVQDSRVAATCSAWSSSPRTESLEAEATGSAGGCGGSSGDTKGHQEEHRERRGKHHGHRSLERDGRTGRSFREVVNPIQSFSKIRKASSPTKPSPKEQPTATWCDLPTTPPTRIRGTLAGSAVEAGKAEITKGVRKTKPGPRTQHFAGMSRGGVHHEHHHGRPPNLSPNRVHARRGIPQDSSILQPCCSWPSADPAF